MANEGRLRLGVNIDHVATVRNARGGAYPDPLRAALVAEEAGADGITAHLREDRRHISDADIEGLMEVLNVPLNFEMAATDEMQKIALRHKPHAVCIVPEKREERTTEGGLEVAREENRLAHFIAPLREAGCRVLYVAGYRRVEDRYKVAEIEAAADVIVWACDEAPGFLPGRPQDSATVANIVDALVAYQDGRLGEKSIDLGEVDRIVAIGSDRMMAAVKAEAAGRADMGAVSALIKQRLSGG